MGDGQNHNYAPYSPSSSPSALFYGPWEGAEDRVTILLNRVPCQHERTNTHARVLYLDMSSAFKELRYHVGVRSSCYLQSVSARMGDGPIQAVIWHVYCE